MKTRRRNQRFSAVSAAMFVVVLALAVACTAPISQPPATVTPTMVPPTAEPPTAEPATPTVAAIPTPVPTPLPMSPADVLNATYVGIYEDNVTLVDGIYEGEPFVEGGASRPTVTHFGEIAFGDLDNDGRDDAALLLVENSGGSGSFVYLAVVLDDQGEPRNAATTLLGDRVQVHSLTIEDGQLLLEMMTHSDTDPMCCPSLVVSRSYALEGGELNETGSEVLEPEAPSVANELLDITWYWKAYKDTAGLHDIRVDDPFQYSLLLNADGTYSIKADCNVGNGVYTVDGPSFFLGPGPITMAACPPGSLDLDYLDRLFQAVAFVISDGMLTLDLPMDAGQMVFGTDPAPLTGPTVLSEETLRNGTYTSEWADDGQITLIDGEWFGEPYVEGGASRPSVLIVEPVLLGDLAGDETIEGVVILAANGGGSGVFFTLEVMMIANGEPVHWASAPLGDRPQINSVEIIGRRIAIDMVTHGPDDPLCCPTLRVLRFYELNGQSLDLAAEVELGADAPVGLTDVVWIWHKYTAADPEQDIVVVYPPAWRLELRSDGQLAAQVNCNTAFGDYKVNDDRIALSVTGMTRKSCGDATPQDAYPGLLEQVETFSLEGDTLLLHLVDGQGSLKFTRLMSVTGSILGSVGESLPENNTIEVRVLDPDGQQVGGQMTSRWTQLPAEFEAPFHAPAIDPDVQYVLEVTIRDADGNVVYVAPQPTPVITLGNPIYHVDVEVQAIR